MHTYAYIYTYLHMYTYTHWGRKLVTKFLFKTLMYESAHRDKYHKRLF